MWEKWNISQSKKDHFLSFTSLYFSVGENFNIFEDNMSSVAAAKVQLEYISQSWYQVL